MAKRASPSKRIGSFLVDGLVPSCRGMRARFDEAGKSPLRRLVIPWIQRAWSHAVAIAVAALTWTAAGVIAATAPNIPPPAELPPWALARKPPPKKALIIGIDTYQFATRLTTPGFDAHMVEDTLKRLDPEIDITLVPADQRHRKGLLDAMDAFSAKVREGDVALIFYSGHGMERNGVNYFMPADAEPPITGREGHQYISIDHLNGLLQEARAGIVVLILDACRTDPFAGATAQADFLELPALSQADVQAASQPVVEATGPQPGADAPSPAPTPAPRPTGLKDLDLPPGFIAFYAASPGKPSYSLFKGESPAVGSIFTRRLVNFVETINKSIDDVFDLTSGDVFLLTKSRQKPLVSKFNGGEIILRANANLAKEEYETWARVANSPQGQLLSQLIQFVSMYPASVYTAAARAKIQELHSTPKLAVAYQVARPSTDLVLSGALQSAQVQDGRLATAVAQQNVFVRASPFSNTARISSLSRGEQVQVVDGAARPGWAKILLQNGTIGYVGSVDAIPVQHDAAPFSAAVAGNDAAAAVGTIEEAQKNAAASSTLVIDVAPAVEENPWRARQKAFLAGLRLRDVALAKGVLASRLAFNISRPFSPIGETRMSVIGAPRQ